MNARELADYINDNPEFWTDGMRTDDRLLLVRALRILAAAEANDGSTPECRAEQELYANSNGEHAAWELAERFERERNALAARVAELEPDAERWRVTRAHHIFNLGGSRTPEEADKSADEAIALLKQRDAARSAP